MMNDKKQAILNTEKEIEDLDREKASLTKDLMNPNFGSESQRRIWHIRRRNLNKIRKKLMANLLFLRGI